MALLSASITPTNLVTTSGAATLTNKTLTGAVMNGTLGATTPSTVVATTVQASTTIGVGGATPSASGSGITFPATQSASSDTNTLDDYEEGTWTPAFTSTGATFAYSSTTNGTYTKVGNIVNLSGYIQLTSITGTLTNLLTITGLPFASITGASSSGVFGVQQFSVVPSLFDDKPSDTALFVYIQGTLTNITPASMNSTGFYLFTITYQTN